ncbi:MAG TPA: c-type cytochrome, methanol metabolism-related [Afifellaceae bacterium]|nr:c-type cytochrome, methanol metabolism-related [Afifellaceae bacterium]
MTRMILAAGVALALVTGAVAAQDRVEPAAVEEEDGKHFDAEGTPTFNVAEDGTVDWYTFSGFRRYHAECHVCHGPDGLGSTYAPALIQSLKRLGYGDFLQIVAGGRQTGNNVMPAFGTNKNVMCYIDDIYVYLRARSEGAVDRGRPAKRADKPEAYAEAEDACMG